MIEKETNRRITGRNGRCGYYALCRCPAGWFYCLSHAHGNQFTDVPMNAWRYNSVKSAYNLGLVNGSSATTYSPNKEVTIAELYAMASRIHAAYYGNEIQPVDGAWFAPYVEYSQKYLDTGSHDNAYSYSDGVLVANLPAARWYFACILYAAVDPDEFNQLNHVLSGSIEDIDAIENEEVRRLHLHAVRCRYSDRKRCIRHFPSG